MNKVTSWIRQKALGLVIRALSLTSRENWPTEDSDAGEIVTQDTMLCISTVWACINLIAGLTGTLPFHVYRYNPRTDMDEIVQGHWLELLLDTPNLDQTSVDFLEFIAASLEMRGNAYCWKRRLSASGPIVALICIRPDWCFVARDRETGRLVYTFSDEMGMQHRVDQDEIWHIRGFGGGPLGGLSTLAFGRHSFGLARAIDKTASSTFKNGARPSALLRFKEWVKGDKRDAAIEHVRSEYTGAMNAGKPMVLEGGIEWQSISLSPEDSQMLQSRGFTVEDCCRWFNMPPILVGHSEKQTSFGTGVTEVLQAFVKFNFRRRIKRIEKSAGQQLLSARERGEGYYLRFDLEGLMRGSPKELADYFEIMSRIGVFTIDYMCGILGIPKPPNGMGKLPLIQAQYMPLSVDLQRGVIAASPPAPKPAEPAPTPAPAAPDPPKRPKPAPAPSSS